MNKKELSEIRKNLSKDSDLFVVNRVAAAFVDGEKRLRCLASRSSHEIPPEEMECLLDTAKRVLSGTLGKGLVEYEFPPETYEEGGCQNLLYNVLIEKLENGQALSDWMAHLVENMVYLSTYAVLCMHCTYTVFQKSSDGEKNPYDAYDYSFLLTAICPVEAKTGGLVYNADENAIERKSGYDMLVAAIPSDGFLYPTFTGRGPDVNHVLYAAHKPRQVNVSLIEEVLGCRFTQTADEQKDTFREVLQTHAGDELSFSVITGINERLQDIAAEYAREPDPWAIDEGHLRDIFLDSGISRDAAESCAAAYREATNDTPVPVGNLLESKITITLEDITISIAKDATQRVHTREENGRRFLLIDLDDAEVDINGLTAKIIGVAEE